MKASLLSCVVLLLLTSASLAQAKNHSVALSYGSSSANTESIYDSIEFIGLAGTYQFNKRWGLELAYINGLSTTNEICNIANTQQCIDWEKNIRAITLAPQYSFYSTHEFWRLNLKAGLAQVKTDFQFGDTNHTGFYWQIDNQFKVFEKVSLGFSFGQYAAEELTGDTYNSEHYRLLLSYQF